jgi:hypothetical protein
MHCKIFITDLLSVFSLIVHDLQLLIPMHSPSRGRALVLYAELKNDFQALHCDFARYSTLSDIRELTPRFQAFDLGRYERLLPVTKSRPNNCRTRLVIMCRIPRGFRPLERSHHPTCGWR